MTMVDVAIIGSGFSGLGMAIRLRERGLDDFVILERRPDVGGTWHDNHYPGAACDIPSHLYSLSFAPKRDWTSTYSRQPEIWAYLRQLADEHDLRSHIRFGREVVRCEWVEDPAHWVITTDDGESVSARVLVNAVGPLKDPAIPEFDGAESFRGHRFHSSRWDTTVDLAGKRVGIVGTGASAIQIVPELAPSTRNLTVFQRTAPWVIPRHDRSYTAIERLAYRRVPGLARLNRALTYLRKEARYPLVFAGRELPIRIAERHIRKYIEREVDDPSLREQVMPDFRIGCKRVLISSDWYPTLTRDDVDLETTSIAGITPDGVELTDGRHIDLDVIVYGTGFTVDKPLGTMEVIGRDGAKLDEVWGERPTGHLGMTVPGFPNSFMLLGPNTGLGHNSVVIMIEAQIRYVLQALDHLGPRLDGVMEVRQEVHDSFVDEVDRRHGHQVWASGCHSWYLNDHGENFSLWPGSTVEYITRTRTLEPSDFRIVRTGRPHADLAATA